MINSYPVRSVKELLAFARPGSKVSRAGARTFGRRCATRPARRIYGPKPDHQSIRGPCCTGRVPRLAILPACPTQLLSGGRLHVRWYTQSRQESSGPDQTRSNERENVTRTRRIICTRAIMRVSLSSSHLRRIDLDQSSSARSGEPNEVFGPRVIRAQFAPKWVRVG